MQILHRDDLISNCDIRVSKNDDILFKLAINQTKLFGTLDIIGVDSYDIVGNITVRRNSSNDIDSRVSISRNTLFSSAKINPVSQIECTIEIKRFSDINSKMNILFREDLHCEIDIISINNINSTLYVNSGYLKSSLLIPYYDKDDIESIIKVKAIWIDELESSIFVGIPNGGYVFIY
ncbi:hypothetical protein D3C75_525150 [compost metagenome]